MNGDGFCGCGCGGRTNLARTSDPKAGTIRGAHYRYIYGHHARKTTVKGYVYREGKLEHTGVVEKALGKRLPPHAVIHHVDEDKTNNSPNNLVVCQDPAYHNLLHRRMRALAACGNANARRCSYCKIYDALENVAIGHRGRAYHRPCKAAFEKRRRLASMSA